MTNAIKNLPRSRRERVNISLPVGTLHLLKRAAARRDRSGFVDRAVRFYAGEISRFDLEKRLRFGAEARASRDLALTEDWFVLEDEIWQKKRNK